MCPLSPVLAGAQGKYAIAEPLAIESKTIREKALGEDHPDVAISFNNLAHLWKSQVCLQCKWIICIYTFTYVFVLCGRYGRCGGDKAVVEK